jgi:diacylglycerol kinase (ATP)
MQINKNVIIIANPTSGSASAARVDKAIALLAAKDIKATVRFTSKAGDAMAMARDAAKEAPRFVMAAGGDGTVNEVLNGLAGTDTPMTIFPLGTANVLALEAGIPFSAAGAIERALSGSERTVQLCRATFESGERYFALMAGIGFDACVVVGIDGSRLKNYLGKSAYVLKALALLAKWAPQKLSVQINEKQYECHNILILNGKKYAGNFTLSPDGDITEPQMDALLIHSSDRLAVIKLALAVVLGIEPGKLKGITAIKTSNLKVQGIAHMQIEGDHAGQTPVTIKSAAATLKMIY